MVFEGDLGRAPHQQPFGWLDTGDLGRIDRDGFVWINGRAKELIKRGGHGIDPGVIEDAFSAHEAVALAAAVGKPDAHAGEPPAAYVQLRPGVTADARDLLEHARRRIVERVAIPRRAVGEIVRGIVGADDGFEVDVQPHVLHGLEVRVRVPRECLDAVRQSLSTFAFRSTAIALDADRPT